MHDDVPVNSISPYTLDLSIYLPDDEWKGEGEGRGCKIYEFPTNLEYLCYSILLRVLLESYFKSFIFIMLKIILLHCNLF